MRTVLALASALALVAVARDGGAQTAGINMGAPVWKGAVATDAMHAAVATGAAHVRVNFRLDDWKSPSDPGFFDAYDRIVDGITSQGIEVYGLLSDELSSDPDDYVAFATAVIGRYEDRVRVWETINEPNDWAGGSSARIPAATFADLHGRLYAAVKVAHPADACWDVKLVTGPLFSFDGASSASYFAEVVDAGRAGGGWKSVVDALGRDPVDGVGYHLYVAQGPDSSEADVAPSANANLDAMKSVMDARGLGDRKIWISEIGYQAESLGEDGQAARLDSTFAALGSRADVASIQWFTIADFGGLGWGLHREGGFDVAHRRPAHERFVAQARAHAPELAAKLVVELPARAELGEAVVAKLVATNLGRATWTDASAIRIGAASGCPSAWAVNAMPWAPAAGEGYATSPTDARRFLPKGARVAQGESIAVEVPLAAPAAIGKQRFAARMLDEGVAWFGSTASAEIEIVAPESAPTSGGPPPTSASAIGDEPRADAEAAGCACRAPPTRSDSEGAARGVAFGAAMVGLALLARRRMARR